MHCSKCGVQNSKEATLCVSCGNILNAATSQPNVESKIRGLAILVLIIGALFGAILPILGAPIIICGIIASVKANRSQGRKGKGYAIAGIVVTVVMVLALPMIMGQSNRLSGRLICRGNLERLSGEILVYAKGNDGCLPTKNWCDLLLEKATVQPKNFVCPSSDDIEWESSYAMNKNIAGMKLTDVSPNVVFFFETTIGLESGPRSAPITIRKHFEWSSDEVVYKDRFNRLGGPKDLLLQHRGFFGQPGCNIVFADGHIEFVTEDKISELQWTVE